MKKFFIGTGKAVLYFLAYFLGQLAVSLVASFAISFYVAFAMGMSGEGFNEMEYTLRATQLINESLYLIMIISGALTILTFLLVSLIRKKKFAKNTGLVKFSPAVIVPIILGGIAFNFVVSFLMSVVPFPQSWLDSYQASSSQLLGDNGVMMWISVVVMAPLVEELTFRGFMYSRLKSGMAKWIAVILTSLTFGVVHGTIIWAIYTFVFSLCLIYVLERTGSLWVSILFHMAFNLVGAAMGSWPEISEIMEEYSLAVIIVSVLVTIGTAVWFTLVTKKKTEEV